jgi:hypothetical protein
MLSGWQAPQHIFLPCGNNLGANQFGSIRDLSPSGHAPSRL